MECVVSSYINFVVPHLPPGMRVTVGISSLLPLPRLTGFGTRSQCHDIASGLWPFLRDSCLCRLFLSNPELLCSVFGRALPYFCLTLAHTKTSALDSCANTDNPLWFLVTVTVRTPVCSALPPRTARLLVCTLSHQLTRTSTTGTYS
jgi:hypothetical protein